MTIHYVFELAQNTLSSAFAYYDTSSPKHLQFFPIILLVHMRKWAYCSAWVMCLHAKIFCNAELTQAFRQNEQFDSEHRNLEQSHRPFPSDLSIKAISWYESFRKRFRKCFAFKNLYISNANLSFVIKQMLKHLFH